MNTQRDLDMILLEIQEKTPESVNVEDLTGDGRWTAEDLSEAFVDLHHDGLITGQDVAEEDHPVNVTVTTKGRNRLRQVQDGGLPVC